MPDTTLAAMIRARYPGSYDDLSDIALESAILEKHPEYKDLPRTKMSRADLMAGLSDPESLASMSGSATQAGAQDVLKAAQANAPAIGGTLGAFGGPLLSGAGGAAGEVIKAAGTGADPSQVAIDAAKTGAEYATLQKAGELVSPYLMRGVRGIGEKLVRSAIKPSVTDAGIERVGNVLDTIGPGNVTSAKKAQDLIDQGMAEKDALLAEAPGSARVSPRRDVVPYIDRAAGKASQAGASEGDVSAINSVKGQFLRNPNLRTVQVMRPTTTETASSLVDEFGKPYTTSETTMQKVGAPIPQPMTLDEAETMARATDKQLGDRVFARAQTRQPMAPGDLGDRALSQGLRKGIERNVPAVGPINQRIAADLIPTRDVLRVAENRWANQDLPIQSLRGLMSYLLGGGPEGRMNIGSAMTRSAMPDAVRQAILAQLTQLGQTAKGYLQGTPTQ